jgi:V/A-type H+-transporting ATPase subunit K
LLIAFLVFIRLDLFNGILGVSTAYGLGIFAACLPVALVGLISAIYQAKVSVSSIAMLAKRPEESGKGIILTVMVETYSVLALLISFLGVYIPTVSLA